MVDRKQDALLEGLIALAASAAPLIKKARDSGMFKDINFNGIAPIAGFETAAARAAATAAAMPETKTQTGKPETRPEPAASAEPAAGAAAERAALQDIIVNQAIKIAALEAEVVRLTTQHGKAKRAKG